jgi:structural maintenance of chromosome 4
MESLLFVFGKRAKRMRLNKLNELIHNSSTQNNLRFARVTIYFKEIRDLEDEKVEDVPNSNFVLSREVYRNASSKYFLNGKDIHFDSLCEILNKKGIDLKHNRFLILQGEVEQISMMKPKATTSGEIGLLEFLEDIIGTTRYVNLIEKLSKDIDELGEIKTQKSNRVKITKNELDQLEDVKNSSTEYYKKEKELHMFGHLDFLLKRYNVNNQILGHQNKIQSLNNNFEEIDKKIQEKVKENSHVIEQHSKIKKEQDILKKKKNEITKMTDDLDEEDKVKRADIENHSKNIAKTKTALEKLNKNYQTQSENIQNARNDLPKKEKERKELLELKKNVEKFIIEKEQDIFEKTEKIQVKKREVERQIQPYEDNINQNKFQIEQNNSTINLIGQKVDKLANDLNLLDTKKNDIDKATQEKSSLSSNLEAKIIQLENSFRDAKNNLNKANNDLDYKYKMTQNLLAKISEIRNSNQEKINKNNILDALLKAQNEGKLSGIYGRLGDLGVIDSKYDVAITTSCSNLDSIVVETVEHGQKCLDFLKKNNIGRGTFLILEKVAWVESKLRDRFHPPNNCERLFDLVKFKNQRLAIAFYFALRDTLVAPDLKTATSVAYGVPRHRVVTLNGELIEISGTMSGGGKPKRGGMSSKEIGEEYSQDYVNKLNQDYENMIKEFDLAKIERNGIESRVNSLNAQLQESLILKNKTDNEIISLQKALKEVEKNLVQLKNDHEKYNKEEKKLNELKTINEDLTAKNEQFFQDSANLRNELIAIDEEIKKIGGDEFNKKKEEFKQMKKRIDTLEKEIHTLKHLTENAPDILDRIKEEIIQKEKVVKDYEEMIENIKKELADIENRGLELFGQIEVCQTQINNFDKMFLDKSKEVEELRTLIRKMREEQEKQKAEIHEINLEIKKLEKNEKLINEDLNKNKKSFKKLVDEFGFIDEFEKEIKIINKRNNKYTDDMMMVDNEIKADSNDLDAENEKDKDLDIDSTRILKLRKITNNYQKYLDPKYIEYVFKMEELEELSKSVVYYKKIIY